nr:serine hydrolase domain-containing protein [Jannaschia sp. S6380]
MALLLACLAAPLRAEPAVEAERLAAAHGTVAVVAVWTKDDGARIAVAGRRHAGGDPVVRSDAWHIGSLTKAMTATLAARMVAQGRIEWDTPIGDLLRAAKPWRDVTLAELLNHRSGMAANLPRWRAVLRPGRATYAAHMLSSAPATPRGETEYSNAGYVVAGAMLEAAGGAPWEDLLRRHVLNPLRMEGAGFGAPDAI